ncbi:oxidoreductase [Syncephalis plumigaleata]|nr:oxidoreductase [Syncephalis plumigaleata]
MATNQHSERKVVLLTGCSSGGIGAYMALEFASNNCIVYASARRLEAMTELEPHGIHTLSVDVTKEETMQAAVNTVIEKEGRIDILVNNAGLSRTAPLIEQDLNTARRVYDANVWGLLRMSQIVAPHMMKRRSGNIVNVSSIVGVVPIPWSGIYASSKAAVRSMSDIMRMELLGFNVNVTNVYPGSIKSNIAQNSSQEFEWKEDSLYEAYKQRVEERVWLSQQKGCTPTDDFAKAVVAKLLQSSPPREIYYGKHSTIFWLLSFLPGWLTDRLLLKRFGLLQQQQQQ